MRIGGHLPNIVLFDGEHFLRSALAVPLVVVSQEFFFREVLEALLQSRGFFRNRQTQSGELFKPSLDEAALQTREGGAQLANEHADDN